MSHRSPALGTLSSPTRPNPSTRPSDHEARHIADPYDSVVNYDQNRYYHRTGLDAETLALTILDKQLDRTDTEFSERASKILDILCIIVSFLSKTTINWFANIRQSEGEIVEVYREMPPSPDPELYWEEVVLSPSDIRRFIGRALSTYLSIEERGVDLRLPINLYTTAQGQRTIDGQFVALFLSLEKMMDILNKMYQRKKLLTGGEMKTVRERVKRELAALGKRPQDIEEIIEKVGELGRAPFKRQLVRNLERLGVMADDIGGRDGIERMIQTRNKIMHAAEEPDIRCMVQEKQRVETIVERVLLRLLGWGGRTNTPTRDNRNIRQEW